MKMPPPLSRRGFMTQSACAALGTLAMTSRARSEATERIKIGQIGTKHSHAAGKMGAIRKLQEQYEVVGIVEPDAERREALKDSEPYRDLVWMTEEELLETPGLAAVAVETHVNDLVPTARRCVAAGLHIHLDKPAGTSLAACRQLHEEADAQSVTIQMGYMLRYNPAFEFLFKVIEDGWLGPITEVSGMMGKKADAALREELSIYPGGGMFELACHLIDALVTVLGPPEEITPFNRRMGEDDDFADNQLAVFSYPRALATIRCNHRDPLGFPRRTFSVTGENGTLEIAPLEPGKVRLGLDRPRAGFTEGFQEVELPEKSGRYDAEFLDLAEVIRGAKKLAWDSAHDVAVQRAVLLASGMEVD